MSLRSLRPVTAFAALAAVAVAQEGIMNGRLDGDTYVSPTGEFKIAVPVLSELGGSVSDTENVVTFNDSFNTHISIACFPLDASQKWELDTRGLRDYLLYFFTNIVLVDFQGRFPGSSVESARFLPELMGGTMITYALLPGGSFFESKNRVLDAPPENPVTAKRGTLLFIRNRHIFVISTELAERATQRSTYKKTVEQEDQILGERLIALTNRLVFTGAKATGQ
jgi:hypothetical protein